MKTKSDHYFLWDMRLQVRIFMLVTAMVVATTLATGQEVDERTYRSSDGSVLKLIENGIMEYESWSGGHMCFLRGQLPDTSKTRKTQEFSFVLNNEAACTGKLKFLDPDGDTITFYTNGQCMAICGARNPPPIVPLKFTTDH